MSDIETKIERWIDKEQQRQLNLPGLALPDAKEQKEMTCVNDLGEVYVQAHWRRRPKRS